MAIVKEYFSINEREFVRTFSDAGRYVVRDGIAYDEACDPAEFGRTYIEGDLMPVDEDDSVQAKAEAFDILIGNIQ